MYVDAGCLPAQEAQLRRLFEEHRGARACTRIIAQELGGGWKPAAVGRHLKGLGLSRTAAAEDGLQARALLSCPALPCPVLSCPALSCCSRVHQSAECTLQELPGTPGMSTFAHHVCQWLVRHLAGPLLRAKPWLQGVSSADEGVRPAPGRRVARPDATSSESEPDSIPRPPRSSPQVCHSRLRLHWQAGCAR